MVDERDSPSDGWRTVYAELGVSPDAHEAEERDVERVRSTERDREECPDCGVDSAPVAAGTFRCPRHGAWHADAD